MKLFSLSVPMAVAGICLISAMPAQAEVFGLANGRSADIANAPQSSVEVGATLGDYQTFGARFNYRISPQIMVYGDVGQSEFEEPDGISFGVGAYYQVNDVLDNIDFAVKGSYHKAGLEYKGADFDFGVIVLEALFSGREGLGANQNINWYVNTGVHRIDLETDLRIAGVFIGAGSADTTKFGIGAGVTMPLSNGEVYGGVDIIDGAVFGVGYRYFLN